MSHPLRFAIFFAALAVLAPVAFASADEPSSFATDSPRLPTAAESAAQARPATPTPTLQNQPPIDMADYAPYRRIGTGSLHGKIAVRLQPSGDAVPPDGFPVYAIPATAYTDWYMGFHFWELLHMGPRTQTIHHGGLQGLMDRGAWRQYGYSGPPDPTKPVPFTDMDERVFHVVRTSRMFGDGKFTFTGLPPGRYFVLAHWPIATQSTSMDTEGTVGYFGDYSGHTSVNTQGQNYLLFFGIVAPVTVTAGRLTTIVPDGPNARLSSVSCGPYLCGRFAIDQWLTLEERNH